MKFETRVAAILFIFLVIFFVPLIPATVFQGIDNIPYDGPNPGGLFRPTNTHGLNSVGSQLFHWGSSYSYELGYYAPLVKMGNSQLTNEGVAEFIVLPIIIILLILLSHQRIKSN